MKVWAFLLALAGLLLCLQDYYNAYDVNPKKEIYEVEQSTQLHIS